VFALSATLLVVTLEVPNSYEELLKAVAGFPAFALGFTAIISLWYNHHQFFAAYPLVDTLAVALNSLLLFVVLLYVYPLKLLAQVVTERFLGAAPDVTAGMGAPEFRGLFLIFGAGVVATSIIFALLHARAWHLRDALALDEAGRYELRQEMVTYAAIALIGLLSMLTAALSLGLSWGLPLWVYLLSPVVIIVQHVLTAPPCAASGCRRAAAATLLIRAGEELTRPPCCRLRCQRSPARTPRPA
jgi:uncharacterized membrane protein